MSAFDAYVQAAYHGGTIPGGPTFTVVHDAETPLDLGYADSIAGFFQRGPTAGTSAHAMVGPEKAIKMLPDNVVAWAAGPMANTYGWHLEQSGYARFTRADWTTAKGTAQLNRAAACLREVHDTWHIPKRWVTDDQLRAAARGDRSQGGMTTHQQITRALGGTTHTDPETNYPRDLLLQAVLGTPQGDDMTPQELLDTPLTAADGKTYPLRTFIIATNDTSYHAAAAAKQAVAAAAVQGAVLDKVIDLLSADHDVSADEIKAAVQDGIKDAVLKVEVTVNGSPAQPAA